MTPYRIDVCHGRNGDSPAVTIEAMEPTSLTIHTRSLNGVHDVYRLTRGDIAMLRGLLANLARWELADMRTGIIGGLEDMDRPAGMDPSRYNVPPPRTGQEG